MLEDLQQEKKQKKKEKEIRKFLGDRAANLIKSDRSQREGD